MLCSYENIISVFNKNPEVRLVPPVPSCPKSRNMACDVAAGKCSVGNEKRCEQELQFYYQDRSFHGLKVVFTAKPNTKAGFVRGSDLQIRTMLRKNIIAEADLQKID